MELSELKTKIGIDTCNVDEIKEVHAELKRRGHKGVEVVTTNPTLFAKSKNMQDRIAAGMKPDRLQLMHWYRAVVTQIERELSVGSSRADISIEVYSDKDTTAEEMLSDARNMYTWIPEGRIKFPTTNEGLKAARLAREEGILRQNMTLGFTQTQAAVLSQEVRNHPEADVYFSPFVGRLDDIGVDGMSLVKNILQMYRASESPVKVLTASVRSVEHLLYAFQLGSHAITVPPKVFDAWFGESANSLTLPQSRFKYGNGNLKPIEYRDFAKGLTYEDRQLQHPLIDKGLESFANDWNNMVGEERKVGA